MKNSKNIRGIMKIPQSLVYFEIRIQFGLKNTFYLKIRPIRGGADQVQVFVSFQVFEGIFTVLEYFQFKF